MHAPEIDGTFASQVQEKLHALTEREDGIFLEMKNGSVALHYRLRPELEQSCTEAMEKAIGEMRGVHLIRGKMVIEAKSNPSNKGGAVSDFLAEPPFAGRTPIFVGDDVTDEDAFAEVNARNGVSIKVGDGRTCARYRAANTAEFLEWLKEAVRSLRGDR
jgi:trehalose 6-phosphate phosphatase